MNSSPAPAQSTKILNAAVIVSALGYFVDIYDLILFSIVRIPSLKELGLEGQELFDQGVRLLNMQMLGMLLGGVFWGVLGDKRGRLSVLFGSILMYSLANIANGLVQTVDQYAWLRLIAGIGLAGELGAGITLVTEVLPTEKRGYGTTLVAVVGIFGAILAANVGEVFHWRTAYFLGGGLGIALLLLRVSVFESDLFSTVKKQAKSRGNFLALFSSTERFRRYLSCILIGVPVWFVLGILVTFAPEFASARGLSEPVSAGRAIMFTYIGMALGDLSSGLLSQVFRSRRKVVLGFILVTLAFVAAYLSFEWKSASMVYALCLGMGTGIGYWAVFVTIGAEQFGTNLRATVTTSVPNFVRGSVVPLSLLFTALKPSLGMVSAAWVVGVLTIVVSVWALSSLEETFSKDLNYLEMT
ncbi:MAG: MFS transporter [Bdellovibrionales bacterium]|nr:MFS transporter [Bdellovibrionales bacterium]